MPTYEYECQACKKTWEAEQRISDPPITACPACKEPQAKRLISAGAGFRLEGTGWAKDGYGGG